MPLKKNEPEVIDSRLKVMIYGEAGIGKTYLCCQFPNPYYLDTEMGTKFKEHIELLKKHKEKSLVKINDFNEIVEIVLSLMREKHEYKTLIIDTLTIPYESLCEIYEKSPKGSSYSANIKEADKNIKKLARLLLRLDMNVIIVCHTKIKYEDKEPVVTFNCTTGLDHIMDLTIHARNIANKSTGFVIKTRLAEFPRLSHFPFEYKIFLERCKNLEKESVPEVLATAKQLAELDNLISFAQISNERRQRWLNQEECLEFEQMNTKTIQKYIDAIKEKIPTQKEENK